MAAENGAAEEDLNGSLTRWMLFELGGELFGADIVKVRAVLRCRGLTPLPGAPACVLGSLKLESRAVPVIDLRPLFGLPAAAAGSSSRIFIVESRQQVCGIFADQAVETADLEAADIERGAGGCSAKYAEFICGVYRREQQQFRLLNTDKLLDKAAVQEVLSCCRQALGA